MVDYSRFDKIVDDLSDDETNTTGPRVTKLDGKTTISVDKDGRLSYTPATGDHQTATSSQKTSTDYRRFDNIQVSDSDSDSDPDDIAYERQAPPSDVKSTPTAVSGGISKPKTVKSYSENGQDCGHYFWSQTRENVTIYFEVPSFTKGKDITVSINTTGTNLMVKAKGKELSLDGGELKFPVVPIAEDEFIDWELQDSPKSESSLRVVRITVVKKAPPRVLAWWNRVFPSEEPTSLPAEHSQRAKESQKVWQQAHEMFKSKVQEMKKQMPEEEIRKRFQQELHNK